MSLFRTILVLAFAAAAIPAFAQTPDIVTTPAPPVYATSPPTRLQPPPPRPAVAEKKQKTKTE